MKKQEGSLNLLKFLATAIIILHHFQQISGAFFEGQLNFYGGNFYWGYMVELFFILSGYFTYKYSMSSNLEEGFFVFWWKKYRRFLPLLVITGISSAISIYWVNVTKGTEFKYTLWTCLAGMFGFGRWFSNVQIINNPTWYINVLLVCYAVFYCGTYFAKRLGVSTNSTYLVIMIIGIIMYHVCNSYAFSMPMFSKPIGRGILCFFEGLLLREILEKFQLHKKVTWLVLCAVYVIGFIVIYVTKNDRATNNLYYLLCFTVFPCIIILFKADFLQKLCSGSFFSSISSITYNTYMWHLTVTQLLINTCRVKEIPFNTNRIMFICLILTFAVGTLSHFLTGIISSKQASQRK